MDSVLLVGIAGIILLIIMLFISTIPVGFVMAIAGIVGISAIISGKVALSTAVNSAWAAFSSYGFSAIPLFIFMGAIVFRSGISKSVFECAYKWVGQLRGGLGIATLIACAGFAAVCGSNTATAATMGTVALPEMRRYKYSPVLTGGVVATGSTLGVVIPPSIVLIVYGLYTGESVSKLFIASIFPGLLLLMLFIISLAILVVKKPQVAPAGPSYSFLERVKALKGAIEVLVIFALLMGGLYKGWFTPTEAGGAGVLFVLAVAGASGKFTWTALLEAVEDTLRLTGMVFAILFGALLFGRFITLSGIPQCVARSIVDIGISDKLFLIITIVLFIVGGMVMDALAFLLVTLPIIYPVAVSYNIDPIWFGIFVNILTTMGAITPPVGVNAFIVGSIDPDVALSNVFRGVIFFLPAYIICIALLILFPQIALILVQGIKG